MQSTQIKTNRTYAAPSLRPAALGISQIKRAEVPVSVPSVPPVCIKAERVPKVDRRVKATNRQLTDAYADGLSTVAAAKRIGLKDHSTVSRHWAFFDLPVDALRSKIPDSLFIAARWNQPKSKNAAVLLGVKPIIVRRRWAMIDAEARHDKAYVRAYSEGLTVGKAAKKLDVDHSTISKAWLRLGLTSRNRSNVTKEISKPAPTIPLMGLNKIEETVIPAGFNGIALRAKPSYAAVA